MDENSDNAASNKESVNDTITYTITDEVQQQQFHHDPTSIESIMLARIAAVGNASNSNSNDEDDDSDDISNNINDRNTALLSDIVISNSIANRSKTYGKKITEATVSDRVKGVVDDYGTDDEYDMDKIISVSIDHRRDSESDNDSNTDGNSDSNEENSGVTSDFPAVAVDKDVDANINVDADADADTDNHAIAVSPEKESPSFINLFSSPKGISVPQASVDKIATHISPTLAMHADIFGEDTPTPLRDEDTLLHNQNDEADETARLTQSIFNDDSDDDMSFTAEVADKYLSQLDVEDRQYIFNDGPTNATSTVAATKNDSDSTDNDDDYDDEDDDAEDGLAADDGDDVDNVVTSKKEMKRIEKNKAKSTSLDVEIAANKKAEELERRELTAKEIAIMKASKYDEDEVEDFVIKQQTIAMKELSSHTTTISINEQNKQLLEYKKWLVTCMKNHNWLREVVELPDSNTLRIVRQYLKRGSDYLTVEELDKRAEDDSDDDDDDAVGSGCDDKANAVDVSIDDDTNSRSDANTSNEIIFSDSDDSDDDSDGVSGDVRMHKEKSNDDYIFNNTQVYHNMTQTNINVVVHQLNHINSTPHQQQHRQHTAPRVLLAAIKKPISQRGKLLYDLRKNARKKGQEQYVKAQKCTSKLHLDIKVEALEKIRMIEKMELDKAERRDNRRAIALQQKRVNFAARLKDRIGNNNDDDDEFDENDPDYELSEEQQEALRLKYIDSLMEEDMEEEDVEEDVEEDTEDEVGVDEVEVEEENDAAEGSDVVEGILSTEVVTDTAAEDNGDGEDDVVVRRSKNRKVADDEFAAATTTAATAHDDNQQADDDVVTTVDADGNGNGDDDSVDDDMVADDVTEAAVSKAVKVRSKGGNMYAKMVMEEERRAKTSQSGGSAGNRFIDDEVEEDEEEGRQRGLGDFGFNVGTNRENRDEEDANKVRIGDFDNIVDSISDDEGDEDAGRRAMAEMDLKRDIDQGKAIMKGLLEGRDAMKADRKRSAEQDRILESGGIDALMNANGNDDDSIDNIDDNDEVAFERSLREKAMKQDSMYSNFDMDADTDDDDDDDGDDDHLNEMTDEQKLEEQHRLLRRQKKKQIERDRRKQEEEIMRIKKMDRKRSKQQLQQSSSSSQSQSQSQMFKLSLNQDDDDDDYDMNSNSNRKIQLLRTNSMRSMDVSSHRGGFVTVNKASATSNTYATISPRGGSNSSYNASSVGDGDSQSNSVSFAAATDGASNAVVIQVSTEESYTVPVANSRSGISNHDVDNIITTASNTAANATTSSSTALSDLRNKIKRRTTIAPKKRPMPVPIARSSNSTNSNTSASSASGNKYTGNIDDELEYGYGMGMAVPSRLKHTGSASALFSAVTGKRSSSSHDYTSINDENTSGRGGRGMGYSSSSNQSHAMKRNKSFSAVSTVVSHQFVFNTIDASESQQSMHAGESSIGGSNWASSSGPLLQKASSFSNQMHSTDGSQHSRGGLFTSIMAQRNNSSAKRK